MRRGAWVRAQMAVKRGLDILLAAALFVLLLPLMLGVAVVVKATSPGGAIFAQTRVGRHGRPFTIYKFRTMAQAAPNHALDTTYVYGDDPRITKAGRFLRSTGLDELPQLVNVLKGDMSFVGPRPDLPYHVEKYTKFQRQRLEVRPGITGWAQVSGGTLLSWEERIKLDVGYIEHWSLLRDLAVILRTAVVIVAGKGTPPAKKATGHPSDDGQLAP